MAHTSDLLMLPMSDLQSTLLEGKITIVGLGHVGSACAYSIMLNRLASELHLIDCNKAKLKGELMDLEHASAMVPCCKITSSTDFSLSGDSKICIITACACPSGDSSVSSTEESGSNLLMIQQVVPRLVERSPGTILLIVSQPVDLLTQYAWKLSGLPRERVLGLGTVVESARLKHMISREFSTSPESCNAWVIGSCDYGFIPWSTVSVGNCEVEKYYERKDISQLRSFDAFCIDMLCYASWMLKVKQSNHWAIALAVSSICDCILYNRRDVYPLSVSAQGYYGIQKDIYLSLLCVLGEDGISEILDIPLNLLELDTLQRCAKEIKSADNL